MSGSMNVTFSRRKYGHPQCVHVPSSVWRCAVPLQSPGVALASCTDTIMFAVNLGFRLDEDDASLPHSWHANRNHDFLTFQTYCSDTLVGSIVIMLLQIFSWFWQWKNFENRLIYDKVKAFNKNCYFGATQYIDIRNQRLTVSHVDAKRIILISFTHTSFIKTDC